MAGRFANTKTPGSYSRRELVDVSVQIDARARRIEAGDWRTLCDLGLSTRPPTRRGRRGGVRKCRQIKIISGIRPNHIERREGVKYQNTIHHQNLIKIPLQPIESKLNVSCLLFNSRSICNKTDTVREHVLDQQADVVFLTETWLKPGNTAKLNDLLLPGYSYVGEFRAVKRGGGVGLLHKSKHKFTKLPSKKFEHFELLDVKTTNTSTPMRMLIVYRLNTSIP